MVTLVVVMAWERLIFFLCCFSNPAMLTMLVMLVVAMKAMTLAMVDGVVMVMVTIEVFLASWLAVGMMSRPATDSSVVPVA